MITFSYKSCHDCSVCQREFFIFALVACCQWTSAAIACLGKYPGFIRVGCCESNGCGMNYGLIYITKRTKPDIFWFLVRFLFSFGYFLSCTFDCI